MELQPKVFVAMSFGPSFEPRFKNIIDPAVRAVSVAGVPLEPYRVDLSRSGDSILTDIMDGIAHAQVVLADVSVEGRDRDTGRPYRNANVLYEVGLTLASRQPTEVLLVRDVLDVKEPFLFDVSTIPHLTVDFTDAPTAIATLREALLGRLRERDLVNDTRVQIAAASLSFEEVEVLSCMATLEPHQVWGRPVALEKGAVDFQAMTAIPRLLDKQLIRVVGKYNEQPAYAPTQLGRVVAGIARFGLSELKPSDSGDKDKHQA